MSRKDYRAVAEVLNVRRRLIETIGITTHYYVATPHELQDLLDSIARDLCRVFARDNSMFDQDRFMRAVQEGK